MMMHTDYVTMIVNDAHRQRLGRAEAYRQAKRAARASHQPVPATEHTGTTRSPQRYAAPVPTGQR